MPDCIVTISGENKIDSAVVTLHDRIIEIGNYNYILEKYPKAIVISLHDAIIIPGFIDCHVHFELTNLYEEKKYNDLFCLMSEAGDWHNERSRKETSDSCKNGQYISLHKGTIFSLDWRTQTAMESDYLLPENVMIAFEIIESRQELAGVKFQKIINAVKHSFNKTQKYYWAPHSLYMVSSKLWSYISKSEHPITSHIAESLDEIEWLYKKKGLLYEHCKKKGSISILEKKPLSPVTVLKKYGALKANTILVHGTWLKKEELEMIADSGCFLCLCPFSNLQLTRSIINFSDVLESGVKFLLGTDSVCASYDLLSEARLLLTNSNMCSNNEIAKKILRAMTLGAANALGISDDYGSIEVGKKASFLVVSLSGSRKTYSLELDIILKGKVKQVVVNGNNII